MDIADCDPFPNRNDIMHRYCPSISNRSIPSGSGLFQIPPGESLISVFVTDSLITIICISSFIGKYYKIRNAYEIDMSIKKQNQKPA